METGEIPQAWLTTIFIDFPMKMSGNKCKVFRLIALILYAMKNFGCFSTYTDEAFEESEQMPGVDFGETKGRVSYADTVLIAENEHDLQNLLSEIDSGATG